MLILSRLLNEGIIIYPSLHLTRVCVTDFRGLTSGSAKGPYVKLGIDAHEGTKIEREEIWLAKTLGCNIDQAVAMIRSRETHHIPQLFPGEKK